eukprot:403333001
MNYQSTHSYTLPFQNTLNKSNVKVVCRIRAPKQHQRNRVDKSSINQSSNYMTQQNGINIQAQSIAKSYTSVRHRTRSTSKEITSPFRHGAALRQTSKESQHNSNFNNTILSNNNRSILNSQRSNSKSNSKKRSNSNNKSLNKVSFSKKQGNNSGLIDQDNKYCIFTTKERSGIIVTSENTLPGNIINESLIEAEDLKYFTGTLIANQQVDVFNFDQVFNESHRQDKFYQSVVSPAVKSFVEGINSSVLLFGPTEGGKTFTLKGKTGVERGILPRAVEDIFNIVKNSEQKEEDYEALNQRMMNQYSEDDQDEYVSFPDSRSQRGLSQTRNFHSIELDSQQPERMFLKISVYQIFIDKVLDLLSNNKAPTTHKAQVNHFIDKETKEVVSKLSNISEKAIFNLEDFYSVLQEAYKNRRLESVSTMNEADFRKKSHFVIGLTLMKRTNSKILTEISKLNFVELCGSEQAVAEETNIRHQSIRQFVTKSFNGLSSQILKSALKKKSSNTHEDGDIKLVNSISQTLTQNSNIILICNVNPGQSAFEHSLPAIKFCSRIRECIIKKLRSNRHNQSKQLKLNLETSQSIDDLSYEQDTEFNKRQFNENYESQNQKEQIGNIQSMIRDLKEDMNFRQQNLERFNAQENERWIFDSLDQIDRLIRNIHDQQTERNKLSSSMVVQELNFLKDCIQKLRYKEKLFSPRNQNFESKYANIDKQERDEIKRLSSQDQDMRQSYGVTSNYGYQSDYKQDQSRQTHAQDPLILGQKFKPQQETINQISVRSSLSPTQYRSQRPVPTQNQYQGQMNQQTKIQEQVTIDLSDRGNINYQPQLENQSQTMRSDHQIQVYRRPQQELSQNLNQTSSINNIDAYEMQSNVHSENDFLNKLNPYSENGIEQKKNSISEQLSPKGQIDQQIFKNNSRNQGFRGPTPSLGVQGKQSQPNQMIKVNTDETFVSLQNINNSRAFMNPLANYINSQASVRQSSNQSLLSQPISENITKLNQLKQETVYQNQQEAIGDINRLIKLGDFEGLKLRFIQVLKEKESQDQILDDQVNIMKSLRMELGQKDDLLEDQDKLIRDAHQQFQATIEEVSQMKMDREVEQNQQTQELAQHMKDLQVRIQELEQEKERLNKCQNILEAENSELIKLRQESDSNYGKVKEENDKLKSNYDILKEHEMNIIKDYESKKGKEIQFYEQKVVEIVKLNQEERARSKDLEEKLFQLRESHQKLEFDCEKLKDDRKHQNDQVEQMQSLMQQMNDERKQIIGQIQDLEKSIQKITDQRDQVELEKKQALNEIGKLHQLVEEMDKNISEEQSKLQDEITMRKQKEQDIAQLLSEKSLLEEQINKKDQQIQLYIDQEEEYKRQLSQMAQMNDDLEMTLTKIKAKEYDKVDVMKKGAEVEGRLQYYRIDNENLVKERNNLDIANVTLKKQNYELEQQVMQLENELNFFKQAHEQHLDKFDQKFEMISVELSKLKNENIQLKEREKLTKRQIREFEQEKEELGSQLRNSQRYSEDMHLKVQEIEREVRLVMQEKERDAKDSYNMQKHMSQETKQRDDQKSKMLDDIQGMIKQYKQERSSNKENLNHSQMMHPSNLNNGGMGVISPRSQNNNQRNIFSAGGQGYSTNSSGYY